MSRQLKFAGIAFEAAENTAQKCLIRLGDLNKKITLNGYENTIHQLRTTSAYFCVDCPSLPTQSHTRKTFSDITKFLPDPVVHK